MRVKKVEYINDFRLKISFSDHKTKIVDLEETLKDLRGIFLPLKNIEYFKKVTLDECQLGICWPNGADFCPDVLYALGKEIKSKRKISTFRKHTFSSSLKS